MAYDRINWENTPSTDTPLNADNLNNMDAGIASLDAMIDAANSLISGLHDAVSLLEARMDTFVALQDGSTTGDAEIIDARNIGDGETYASLQAALRAIYIAATSTVYWNTIQGRPAIDKGSAESSIIEGNNTSATSLYAHAEGNGTTATGQQAHSEGYSTQAVGVGSHAENHSTHATGDYSHTEGSNTEAAGQYSHAEGVYTSATHRSQHVFGEHNVPDTSSNGPTIRGTYVEIVGNGEVGRKSNARTLDWYGNEAIAGALTIGKGTSDEVTITPSQLRSLLQLIN